MKVVFGAGFDLALFDTNNGFTGRQFSGRIDGIRVGDGLPMNQSILADLLFNVPPSALFVPANGIRNRGSDEQVELELPRAMVRNANCYLAFFSGLRIQLRAEGLSVEVQRTKGEALLAEAYDPAKWIFYKERFDKLAVLSDGYKISDPGERMNLAGGIDDAMDLSMNKVLDPEFAHWYLDARHMQAILGSDYGRAKAAMLEFVSFIAENPTTDEGHEIAATQLFHRMKLLEYEFYKEFAVASHGPENLDQNKRAAFENYMAGLAV